MLLFVHVCVMLKPGLAMSPDKARTHLAEVGLESASVPQEVLRTAGYCH